MLGRVTRGKGVVYSWEKKPTSKGGEEEVGGSYAGLVQEKGKKRSHLSLRGGGF